MRAAYRTVALLARGGMAEVHRAVLEGPHGTQKPCVIKRIAPAYAGDARFRRLFLDEARVSMLLNHPNLVQAFELGEQDGSPFLAMELVEGASLAQLIRAHAAARRPFPLDVAVAVAVGTARGLAYAHRLQGLDGAPLHLAHRDVSPQNILLSREGAVKLADFGIAVHDLRDYETEGPTAKGKPGYIAPEQALGMRVDGRADVFALGVVMAELVSGARLGPQPTVEAVVARIAALCASRADASDELRALVRDMTTVDPEARPSAAEVIPRWEALARALGGAADVGALVREWGARGDPRSEAPTALARHPGEDGLTTPDLEPRSFDLVLESGEGPPLPRSPPSPLAPVALLAPVPLVAPGPAPGPAPVEPAHTLAIVRGEAAPRAPRPMASPPEGTPAGAARESAMPPGATPRSPSAPSRGRWLLVGACAVGVAILAAGYALRSPPAPLGSGTLHVLSEPPGAAVLVDGVDTGLVTPAVLRELPLGGARRVALRSTHALASPAEADVELTASAPEGWARFTLIPARTVRLTSTPPGANVIGVHGRLDGRTPIELPTKLRHTDSATFTVELPGYLPARLVVATGTRALAHVALVRGRRLSIASVPDGARATVDGIAVGETPVSDAMVPAERPFLVRLERRGYARWQRRVEPRQVQGRELTATLVELPLLALPLTPDQRDQARALLAERRRMAVALSSSRRVLAAKTQALQRVRGERQRFVSVVAEAEAAVRDAQGAVDEAQSALDRVEAGLDELREAAAR